MPVIVLDTYLGRYWDRSMSPKRRREDDRDRDRNGKGDDSHYRHSTRRRSRDSDGRRGRSRSREGYKAVSSLPLRSLVVLRFPNQHETGRDIEHHHRRRDDSRDKRVSLFIHIQLRFANGPAG